MILAYRDFLANASAGLLSAGAQFLLPPDSPAEAPGWAHGWDMVLLLQNPGSTALFAFTQAERADSADLRRRLDQLAEGLSQRGAFTQGPISLVAVIAFGGTEGDRGIRTLQSLTPSTFYPGLRPSTWLADLRSGRLHAGRRFSRPDGWEVLEQALNARTVWTPGTQDTSQLQRQHRDQMQAFYGLMRANQPRVTYALIAVNIALFGLLYLNGGPTSDVALERLGALSPRLIEQGQVWRLFTAIFLHAGVAHILFNMTSLFAVGTLAERLYGSIRFLGIYIGAGLIGSLVSFGYAIASNNINILGVGASGAIFGVAGALITVRFQPSDVIPRRVRERISTSMIPLALISLGFAYLTPYVDNSAHIGGLIGGMALSFFFPLAREAPNGAALSVPNRDMIE